MPRSDSARLRQPLRFSLVGVLNTVAGLSVIYLLKWLVGAGDVLANALGYSVGLMVSFLINGRWTFRFDGRMTTALPRFVALVILAYLANLLVVTQAISRLGMNSYAAQGLGVVPYALLTFLGMKYFVFANSSARH